MFPGSIDYTTCLIMACVDTLATRSEHPTKRFCCRRVLPENSCLYYLIPEKIDLGIMNKLHHPKTFQSLTVKLIDK